MLLRPLLIVILKILGLIWWGIAYFVQNNTTITLSSVNLATLDKLRSSCRIFAQNKKLRGAKYFRFSTFTKSGIGIINSFSRIFDTVYSEKRCPGTMFPFFGFNMHWFQGSSVLLTCWLVNLKFQAQGHSAKRKRRLSRFTFFFFRNFRITSTWKAFKKNNFCVSMCLFLKIQIKFH